MGMIQRWLDVDRLVEETHLIATIGDKVKIPDMCAILPRKYIMYKINGTTTRLSWSFLEDSYMVS
jgi:hypothetical protein